MIGMAAIAARRPWLAAAALAVAIGGALLPTPAVPLTKADAEISTGPDDGASFAERLTVRTVLRVTGAAADRPALRAWRGGVTTV